MCWKYLHSLLMRIVKRSSSLGDEERMRSQSRDAYNSNLPIRESKRRIHMARNDEDSVLQHNLHLMAVFSFKQHYVSLGQWILHSVVMNWSSQMNVFNKEHTANRLFIDPLLVVLGVLNESLREPELDLTLSRLDGVRSVSRCVPYRNRSLHEWCRGQTPEAWWLPSSYGQWRQRCFLPTPWRPRRKSS